MKLKLGVSFGVLCIVSGIVFYVYDFSSLFTCKFSKQALVSYRSEDVTFSNPISGLQVAGVLRIPDGNKPCPGIVLVAGTGRHDRDCTAGGHKLFAAIADYLAARGIAVLCYDKRGVGQSQGVFDGSLTTRDFADDARAAFNYLQNRSEVDSQKVGLLGHSEGGLIVCMLAAEFKDIKFIVSMAGAATTSIDNIVKQAGMQMHADGASQEIIDLDGKLRAEILTIVHQEPDIAIADKQLHQLVATYLDSLTVQQAAQVEALVFDTAQPGFEPQAPVYAISKLNSEVMIHIFNSQWVRYLLNYDAFAALTQIKIPVLAINGALDFVVAADVSLPIIQNGLRVAGNHDYKIVKMPYLNHWLEHCKTGSILEYGKTQEDIAPEFLELIGSWMSNEVKK